MAIDIVFLAGCPGAALLTLKTSLKKLLVLRMFERRIGTRWLAATLCAWIINISSTYGSNASAGLSHYGASKAALEYLTRACTLELAPIDVRVNAIAVGPTKSGALTGMAGLSTEEAEAIKQREQEEVPLGRRGLPEEVAHWTVTFGSPGNSWVTGQAFGVDGGLGFTQPRGLSMLL